MFNLSRNKDRPNIEKYEKYIRQNGYILLDKAEVLRIHEEEDMQRESIYMRVLDYMKYKSTYKYSSCSREVLYNYLTNVEICPDYYFSKKGVKSFSLDIDKVLEPLRKNGYAEEFLDLYINFKHLKDRCEGMSKLLSTYSTKFIDGKELVLIPYSINKNANCRYNYKDANIISQIPSQYKSTITVEPDHVLVWGDLAQADLRVAINLFLQSPEYSELFLKYPDMYEAVARLIAIKLGNTFDYDKFVKERPLYKKHTLATLYGTRNSIVKGEQGFIQSLADVMISCDKYSEYLKRIEDTLALDVPIKIEGYFGDIQSVPYIPNSVNSMRNFMLNSPVQMCTAEILILLVCSILDRFYKSGFNEEIISVYMVRHDEVIFKVHKDFIGELWRLQDYTTIKIDNWSPLKMDFSIGYNYTLVDRELMRNFKAGCKMHEHELTPQPKKVFFNCNNYYPLDKIANITAQCLVVEDETVSVIYDENLKAANIFKVYSNDNCEIQQAVIKQLSQLNELYSRKGYKGMLVKSNFIKGELYNSINLIKCVKCNDFSLNSVSVICETVAAITATKKGIEHKFRNRDLTSLLGDKEERLTINEKLEGTEV